MPLDVLLAIMRDGKADQRVRLEAAKAAAPFMHAKAGEEGKKGARQAAAAKVAAGKFAPAAAPRLVVNNAK
jgi:phage terminase small subunit